MKILKPKFWDKKNSSFFSLILQPVSLLYECLIYLKYFLTKKKNFSIPVICVGNIYIGGTGKTPVSIKVFETFKRLKMNPVIIRKDYKDQKDEVLLLKKYSEVLVFKNRIEAIQNAINNKFDVVILDDGYQDFEVKKDINIICFNEKQKIGNGFTLPSGPLRQNLKYLNNCDLIFFNGNKDIDFEKNMKKFNSNLEFIYYEYVSSRELAQLKDKELIAFAGIGNPENFFDFLKKNNLNIIKEIKYPDHFNYSKKHLDFLIKLKNKHNAELITTEKDYMRLDSDFCKDLNYIPIKIKLKNSEFFDNYLKKRIS
tara:strand:- start:10693 stop:11628 length:936 start_codon:yes stop_codon:yes gene_type:complete